MYYSMERIWDTVAPTLDQVLEDVLAFENVLDQIIAHRGCVVPELNFRSGHRAE